MAEREDDTRHPSGRQTVYGRRRGRKLRPGRAELLDRLLSRLAVPLPPAPTRLDWRALFPRPVTDLWLEVGFGAGEHVVWQAEHHPDIGFIGCEPFVNGVGSLLTEIDRGAIDNIRIHAEDARQVIDALPVASVGRCFVLFPDPWPKARHHRRRFVRPDNLDALARILKDGADLRLASDHAGLVDWMLYYTRRHGAFRWTARRAADWRGRPPDWPPTRYESKALHGPPVFLTFRRQPRR